MDEQDGTRQPFRPWARHTIGALAALLAASSLAAGGETSRSPGAPPGLLITAVSIVKAEEDTVTGPHDILLAWGKITEVGPAGSISRDRADRVLAADGLFALPGLIDVHTHLGDGGIGEQTDADRAAVMTRFLRYGVTSTLNLGGGGGSEEELATWKARCRAQELDCPDVYGTGVIITAPGGHPIATLWNLPPDTDTEVVYRRGAVAVAEEEDVAPLLDRKAALGVDAVKIIIEDWDPVDPIPRLSKAKIAELAAAGHARDLRVFAHVSTSQHIEDALAGGVDGVVHSAEDRIPDAILAAMAKRGMFYVPTLALYDGFIDRALGLVGNTHEPYAIAGSSSRAIESLRDFGHSPFTAEQADLLRKEIFDSLRRAAASGVPLALGTDVNNPSVFPGYSAHEELELMVEAGLTPAEALAAATTGGARLLGRESSLGRIEPGYEADLLILQHNPLHDILHTRALRAVIHDGRLLEDVVRVGRLPAGSTNVAPLARSSGTLTSTGKPGHGREFPALEGPYLGQKPPGMTAEVFAPGVVSTDGWEVEGVFAPGMKEFYFTTTGGAYPRPTVIGFRQENDVWRKYLEFPRDGEVTFSPDGNRMHMAEGYKDRVGDGWSERKSLGPMFEREDWGIMRLTASANGTYVFDDYKSNDVIRMSELVDGKRQAPKLMGPAVNEGEWTAHPFIAPDESYLIWDSEREGGFGDSDLYISFRQEDGSWGPAINMGAKVNSDRWDAYATVTPDGKYILFQRGVDPDNENVDIYWVDARVIEELTYPRGRGGRRNIDY